MTLQEEQEFDNRVHSIIEGRASQFSALRRIVRRKKSTERVIETIEASSGIIYQIK